MDPIHFINWHLSARFFVWSMPEPVWFYSRLVSCSMNTWFNDWLIFAWLKQMLLTSSSSFSGHDNRKEPRGCSNGYNSALYKEYITPRQNLKQLISGQEQVHSLIKKMKPSLRQMRESFIKCEIPKNKNFIRIRNKNFWILLVILKLSLSAIKISWSQCMFCQGLKALS